MNKIAKLSDWGIKEGNPRRRREEREERGAGPTFIHTLACARHFLGSTARDPPGLPAGPSEGGGHWDSPG